MSTRRYYALIDLKEFTLADYPQLLEQLCWEIALSNAQDTCVCLEDET